MNGAKSLFTGVFLLFAAIAHSAENLVYNGSFEIVKDGNVPDGWSAAGNAAVKQKLSTDIGRDGKRCAKLECFEFNGDGPDYHAMICQVNKISLKRGNWYRISFFARGSGIRGDAVDVGLNRTRQWENVGLSEAFIVSQDWQRYEFVFLARSDLPADASRLQFWFKSPGVLWLDDVEIVQTEEGRQWFPQIGQDDVKNLIPNSSFECDTAGWGSFTYGLSGWAGNLYKLEGEIDNIVAYHGRKSLKIALNQKNLPTYYFDYFTPVAQKVKRVYAANMGWFKVNQGEQFVLSAYMRGDSDGVKGEMIISEPEGRRQGKAITLNKNWQRYEFRFKPNGRYFFVALGLDLETTGRDAATVWIDAVQLERGDRASDYQPRHPVESFILAQENISFNPAKGIELKVVAYNDAATNQKISGRLSVTDFYDNVVSSRDINVNVPAKSFSEVSLKNLNSGKLGFFRVNYSSENCSNSIRCAVIESLTQANDSPLGFNHAYPWDFLVELTHRAGLVWWRDWSAKWDTIEPEKGRIDFSVPDVQIKRVLNLNGNVEVLLPFPSARWSTSAKPEEIEKAAGNDSYLKARLPLAFMPESLEDFGNHAASVVSHYSSLKPVGITHYQILNEPVYTSYALPRQFGYTLDDYIKLLAVAYKKMKEANPQCKVVGGISANLESGLTRDFITRGGLNYVDIFDIHNYDPPRAAESFEDSFATLWNLIEKSGTPKPVWITEWGCYADDDPPVLPFTAGDSAMNRSRWQSERAAAEHIVKYTAIAFAYGFRKIFFHAGTCGTINNPDAGGVLYEYGGAPRKMYVSSSVLCRLLGVPDECVKKIKRNGNYGYIFKSKDRYVAICWSNNKEVKMMKLTSAVECYDVVGNKIGKEVKLTQSPLYFISKNEKALVDMLDKGL
ncbi:MAG: carbohydrate binding domain-containing protein [Verrucomicrobiia bacterium]